MDSKVQNNSVETINDRNWNILLDAIDRERVVPIIGDEFFYIKDEESGTDMRIDAFLIKELSRKFNIFINDKDYDEKMAKDYFHKEEVERKAAADAIAKGDLASAKRHEAAANSNHKLAVEYQEMARKSTK